MGLRIQETARRRGEIGHRKKKTQNSRNCETQRRSWWRRTLRVKWCSRSFFSFPRTLSPLVLTERERDRERERGRGEREL
jgi:hypothetical protein